MEHGKIIVLEGLDGSGKHTQSEILFNRLKSLGEKVKMISLPNYESESSGPVKMYLNREISDDPKKINPYASSTFFMVDRFIDYFCNWKNFYELSDSILICDRYSTSNMIYQLAKVEKQNWNSFLDWLSTYEYEYMQIPRPDIVIYLKVPVKISQKLIIERSKSYDLHESNLHFLSLCEKACEYSSKKFGWKIVNCSDDGENINSVDDISSQVFDIVNEIL